MEVLEKLSGESMREYIIRVLKHNIIHLSLKPGQNISETDIAAQLGVSRTPVREAFIVLSHESLLEVYPQKGTYISAIDLNLVEEARFLRLTMEKAIIKMACDFLTPSYTEELEENLHLQEFYLSSLNSPKLLELDNQFHRILFKACKKERIFLLIESVNTHFNRIRMLRLTTSFQVDKILFEHREILSAIKEKDAAKLERLIETHLTGFKIEHGLLQEQYPDYFKR